jgi:hypothetical protein
MRPPHKHPVLDTYGLPRRLPVVFRLAILMVVLPGVGAAIWLLLPHDAAGVAVLVIYVLLAGVLALWRISTAAELSRRPGRHPTPPPSTTPPSTS